MNPLPAFRHVDVVPMEHDGETVICLQDPQGYVEDQLALSPPAFFIATCLDGERDVGAVQAHFAQHFSGVTVPEEQIVEVASFLDEHGFLLSERFDSIAQRVDQAFRENPHRPAHLAGRGYPAEPEGFRELVDAFFTAEEGPGPLGEPGGVGESPLPCLIVPHIDFHRGGLAYAHGYHRLHRHGRPKTVFVFGVGHAGAPVPYVLTRKGFETPFGVLETDGEALDALEAACDWDPYEYEAVHRTEHSIEFQAAMLGYLYGTDIRMVPILCTGYGGEAEVAGPGESEEIGRFLEACHEIAADPQRRVTVIAGADLAHVGQRFGDAFEITDAVVEAVAGRDQEDLAHAVSCSPERWYASVMQDENQRRVCGLGCIYAALKSVDGDGRAGEIIHYDSAPDPAGGIVSFASVAIG